MYTIVVEGEFSALHRVSMPNGEMEPLHGHDWIVRVHVGRAELDDRGMVVDFCQVRSTLNTVLGEVQFANLNEHEAFSGRPATAEGVARFVFDRLTQASIGGVCRVEVQEAPGCMAAYEPPAA